MVRLGYRILSTVTGEGGCPCGGWSCRKGQGPSRQVQVSLGKGGLVGETEPGRMDEDGQPELGGEGIDVGGQPLTGHERPPTGPADTVSVCSETPTEGHSPK